MYKSSINCKIKTKFDMFIGIKLGKSNQFLFKIALIFHDVSIKFDLLVI